MVRALSLPCLESEQREKVLLQKNPNTGWKSSRCPNALQTEKTALAYQYPNTHSKSSTSPKVTSSLPTEERTSTFTVSHNWLYSTTRTTTKVTFIMTVFIFLVFIAHSPKQYSYFTGGRGIAFPDWFFFLYIYTSAAATEFGNRNLPQHLQPYFAGNC